MSEPQGSARVATLARKHVEILIVESNSGDIYLTGNGFTERGTRPNGSLPTQIY
jgi:hypothetical protein